MNFKIGDKVKWVWYDYPGGISVAGGDGIIIMQNNRLVIKHVTPYEIIYQDLDKLLGQQKLGDAKIWKII